MESQKSPAADSVGTLAGTRHAGRQETDRNKGNGQSGRTEVVARIPRPGTLTSVPRPRCPNCWVTTGKIGWTKLGPN